MSIEIQTLLSLAPQERLNLVYTLWDSLNPSDIPLSAEQKAELDRRKAAHLANPDAAISWDSIKRSYGLYDA
jgi:putative addiction module component (TIGR02574 family)